MSQPHCPHRNITISLEIPAVPQLYCPDCKQTFAPEAVICQTWRKVVQLIENQRPHHHGLFCNMFGCDK